MRKIQAGNYTFVSKPSKFTQLTSVTNILLDNLKGSTVNYTKAPLANITTDKFVLAVDSPDDSHRYTLYAYEDTVSSVGLTVNEGWWWFNTDTNQLISIDPPTIPIKSDCTLLSTVTDEEYNALFTEPFIVEAPKEYKRVWSQGQRDTNINDFEAMSEVNPNMSYNIIDYPNTGITNEQMIKVLTTNRLFSNSEAFICLDDGVYSKGHIYKLNIVNDSKSWEDITPESTPSTGTNIQVTELPPASAENAGRIVQFITEKEEGEEPVQGHWYKCKPVAADEGRYEWVKQSVQNKDYIVNTSNRMSGSSEDVGKMVYNDPNRKLYWIPYIALGELAQLVNYQDNITVHYTIEDDSYPGGLTKSDEMVWHADSNEWISTATTGFYAISKQADMFGSETLTKPLYTATYMENDLVVTSRKITVTSIDLANGTSITIPTGYGEAKFYNYSIGVGYSSPIDFYSKFESGNLTDADIEAFKFMAVNQVTVTFDINKLKIETEYGLKPLKDYLGGSPLFKHELVIPYSFSVGDSETVNGSVMYHYLSNTGTQITSASEIDDNFMLSGGIGKNTANTVLLLNITVIKAGSSITVEAVNASTMGYITGTVGTITDTVTQLI